ncbi:MAG: acetoin utilization protein AcuC [Deltaproteobacteria bacterium]|nr:acetoin utilization protein AcuC [Deltaproteobacteria bacterium]MBW2072003.1 acetoin utilization protein AcuC [Deltaproteobacteria bacterium]
MTDREDRPGRRVFLYSERYFSFSYGMNHPLKIDRLRLTYELCQAYGLFDLADSQLMESEPASEAEVLRFHTRSYLEALKQASKGQLSSSRVHGLGYGDNPVFPGLWEWSLLHTGASLQGARLLSEGKARLAFNIAGGLHHALADRASGFCYLNDPVVAIHHFLEKGMRVLYLDIDAHHGDGVQWAFYHSPEVLTVSFHQDGRSLFPGTGSVSESGQGRGAGYAVNIPMLPGADDEVFLRGFRTLVPPLMDRFQPDVIVSQLGVDSLREDPLASLELTTNGFAEAVAMLLEFNLPLLALGGGGYHIFNVARAWTLAWAIMNQVEIPDTLPPHWPHNPGLYQSVSKTLRDQPHRSTGHERCARYMDECLSYLTEHVLPLISKDTG